MSHSQFLSVARSSWPGCWALAPSPGVEGQESQGPPRDRLARPGQAKPNPIIPHLRKGSPGPPYPIVGYGTPPTASRGEKRKRFDAISQLGGPVHVSNLYVRG